MKITKAEQIFLNALDGNNLLVIKRSKLHVRAIALQQKNLVNLTTEGLTDDQINREQLIKVTKV